jgi:hypothetical protein
MEAQRELHLHFFFNLGTRWGEGALKAVSSPLYPGKGTRFPFFRKLGVPRVRSWMGAENLALTGIRSADRPVRSESL